MENHLTNYSSDDHIKKMIKRDQFQISGQYHFLVINYEQARIHIDQLVEMDFDFVILDESHRIKNRKAKTTKALWKLRFVRYKLILSGTPVPKDEIDLWSQFKFLNDKLWGANFNVFEKRALKKIDRGDYFQLKPVRSKIKPFMDKAKDFTYQLKLDDMTDMPSKVDVVVKLSLSGKQRKAYNELEKGFLTEYKGKRSSSDLGVTNMIRLQQLVGGHLVAEDGDAIRFKEQPKLWWILDKLEDIGNQKLLIFCRFSYEIELIASALHKLGYSYEVMKGGMKKAEIARVRKSFQSKTGCQVLIGQISVVKEGNNFQHHCRFSVFYSKSLSYVDIDQCKRRTWRNGQKRKVVYYHLIMKNTIDEPIETIVKRKYNNAEDVLLRLMVNKRNKKMAKVKKEKKAKADKKEKKSNLPKYEAPEFGIDALAKELGIDARSVRVKLRNAGVEKEGRTYDFKNKAGVEKVAKQLSAGTEKKAKKEKVAKKEKKAA